MSYQSLPAFLCLVFVIQFLGCGSNPPTVSPELMSATSGVVQVNFAKNRISTFEITGFAIAEQNGKAQIFAGGKLHASRLSGMIGYPYRHTYSPLGDLDVKYPLVLTGHMEKSTWIFETEVGSAFQPLTITDTVDAKHAEWLFVLIRPDPKSDTHGPTLVPVQVDVAQYGGFRVLCNHKSKENLNNCPVFNNSGKLVGVVDKNWAAKSKHGSLTVEIVPFSLQKISHQPIVSGPSLIAKSGDEDTIQFEVVVEISDPFSQIENATIRILPDLDQDSSYRPPHFRSISKDRRKLERAFASDAETIQLVNVRPAPVVVEQMRLPMSRRTVDLSWVAEWSGDNTGCKNLPYGYVVHAEVSFTTRDGQQHVLPRTKVKYITKEFPETETAIPCLDGKPVGKWVR